MQKNVSAKIAEIRKWNKHINAQVCFIAIHETIPNMKQYHKMRYEDNDIYGCEAHAYIMWPGQDLGKFYCHSWKGITHHVYNVY